MNPLAHAANLGAAIGFLAFFMALLLTLWSSRRAVMASAILFAIGTWVSLGILARNFFIMGAIAYGTSDSGSANTAALVWYLLPVTLIGYALGAPILLCPSIPQKIAMRCGTLLNLVFIPLLALLAFFQAYESSQGYILPDELKWLAYSLLWFRIRQRYVDL